jgi:hypothetical protein
VLGALFDGIYFGSGSVDGDEPSVDATVTGRPLGVFACALRCPQEANLGSLSFDQQDLHHLVDKGWCTRFNEGAVNVNL